MTHRVLFMISSMRGGGSEQQTLMLLRHLDRSRFAPHLYLLERAGELMKRVPSDVTVHCFGDAKANEGLYVPGRVMRRQVRHLESVLSENKIDVIYDRTFTMTLIAGSAGRRVSVPRVSTIVSPPEYALPLVESRFVQLKRWRLARAYRQSHAVIAVSPQAATSAENYYSLPQRSVHVIHNPVDVEAVRRSARNGVDRPDDSLVLVCVGRMTEEKGHRDLISAIIELESRLPEDSPTVRLWLVGDGPLRGELESMAAATTGRCVIEFLGKQECPAAFISAADALVLPSLFEGMPNVVLEAMALETPVIATRSGGTIALERDEPTILWAEPGRPDSLADALVALTRDRPLATRHAAAASRMIKAYHDPHTITRDIESLLSDAAGSAT